MKLHIVNVLIFVLIEDIDKKVFENKLKIKKALKFQNLKKMLF